MFSRPTITVILVQLSISLSLPPPVIREEAIIVETEVDNPGPCRYFQADDAFIFARVFTDKRPPHLNARRRAESERIVKRADPRRDGHTRRPSDITENSDVRVSDPVVNHGIAMWRSAHAVTPLPEIVIDIARRYDMPERFQTCHRGLLYGSIYGIKTWQKGTKRYGKRERVRIRKSERNNELGESRQGERLGQDWDKKSADAPGPDITTWQARAWCSFLWTHTHAHPFWNPWSRAPDRNRAG